MNQRIITYNDAVAEGIQQEMRRDPSVFIMGEDIVGAAGRPEFWEKLGGAYGKNRGLIGEFGPGRVIDMPVSEMAFCGAGVGAAMAGARPIVDIMFIDLIGCCYDQLINQAPKIRYMTGGGYDCPVVFKTSYGGRAVPGLTKGGGAGVHHSQTMYSVLAHFPGLKVVAPANPYDAKGLMIAAIRDKDPVVYLTHRFLGSAKGHVPEEEYTVPIGKAKIAREGSDLTLVGMGGTTALCLEAANLLAADGMEAEVVDVRTLNPIDEETIFTSVEKTHRLIVVDEDTPVASLGRDIAARVAEYRFGYLDAPIKCVNSANTPVPYSAALEEHLPPTPEKIVAAVNELLVAV